MNKVIVAVLSLAVGLNVLYTVYSYNQMNKWKTEHFGQQEEMNKKVDDQLSLMSSLIDSNSNMIGNVNHRSNEADSKIVKTMMSLETRLYELEDKLEMFTCNPLSNDCK